ncbi:17020_t:CDS:2 [Rhizophagus irregularis]|nr:17020_t:CDS:2 [Rhizophagus irregularis]
MKVSFALKPLASLVTNPVSTSSQNQIFSDFKIDYTLTPSFQYLENESNEINKKLEYFLQESSETIFINILNVDTQSFN